LGVPVKARYLRLYPRAWKAGGPAALRAGVIKCGTPALANQPIPAYSGTMCSAHPGNEWALFTAVRLTSFWEVREVRFFGNADCTWPLDIGEPVSSGDAWVESSRVTRGPVAHSAKNAFDGKSYTTWISSCAFPCEAGEAYIGVRISTPAAVRCVWLEQHGDFDRTAPAVELRVRDDPLAPWQAQNSWYGIQRTCKGGATCALAVFSA